MQRVEKDEYPVAALREMLLNALVHRTYMGALIQLRVYDNRLSIWNEGALPFGLTVKDLKGEHNSRPRNPKIAKACFMAGYIDAWGRGTLKIYNSCTEHGLPEPDIIEKDGGFMVTLHKVAKDTNEGDVIGGAIGGVIGGAIGGVIDSLTERQKDVLRIIKENNAVTYKGIAEKLSINESAVGEHIKALKEKGAIKRDGSTRGKWLILINI